MANLKMVDLGAPPASMIPVQQDVESAGQVGRAIAGLGQQAMQITQQIYQRKQQQDESYAISRLQQVGKAYEDAIDAAATDDSLSADPEAAIKAAKGVADGDEKKLYTELKHLTLSDSQRREFKVRMETLRTTAENEAHLKTQKWDVKYKANVGQEVAEDWFSSGKEPYEGQKEQYFSVRADLSTAEKELAWGKLLQLGTFSRTKLAINAAPTEQQAQSLGDVAFNDQTLTVDQRVAARDEATQQANKIRITADREQSDAAQRSIVDFSVTVAKGAQAETVSNWGNALMADEFSADSPLLANMPDKMKANVAAMNGDARRALGATMVGQAVNQAGKGGSGVTDGTFIGYLDAVQKGEDMSQELNNPKLSKEQRAELMQSMAGQYRATIGDFGTLLEADNVSGWEDVQPILQRVLKGGETITWNQRRKFAGAVSKAITLGHMKEEQAQSLVRLVLEQEAINTSKTEVKDWLFNNRTMTDDELAVRKKGAQELAVVLDYASRNEAIELLDDYYTTLSGMTAKDFEDANKTNATPTKWGSLYEQLKVKAARSVAAQAIQDATSADIDIVEVE